MMGVQVRAMMVRNSDGKPMRDIGIGRPRVTDDRGVYRLYGLTPGTYVVFTRSNMLLSPISAYDGYAPTYHPSSPRETAAEITVTSGGESTGVDIRYRGERGYTVSGTVTGPALTALNAGTSVGLYNASTGFQAGTAYIRSGDDQNGFVILGVTSGEYEILARRSVTEDEHFSSPPRRITVKGEDLSGIELKLAPTAMVSGKIVEMAPGKYMLLIRDARHEQPDDIPPAPAAWDANERIKLRKEAEALKVEVDLKPCQRVSDQVVKYR
jgi:hypothetical protein